MTKTLCWGNAKYKILNMYLRRNKIISIIFRHFVELPATYLYMINRLGTSNFWDISRDWLECRDQQLCMGDWLECRDRQLCMGDWLECRDRQLCMEDWLECRDRQLCMGDWLECSAWQLCMGDWLECMDRQLCMGDRLECPSTLFMDNICPNWSLLTAASHGRAQYLSRLRVIVRIWFSTSICSL